MVHAALRAAGVPRGRYTSPHLVDLTERFVIGDAAGRDRRARGGRRRRAGLRRSAARRRASCRCRRRSSRRRPRSRSSCSAAPASRSRVIEVGLGGRFDATNVITPVAGAITTIGFDHQQHLGHTLEAIAFEKAGIIKPGMTVVPARCREARDVIAPRRRRARRAR